MNKNFEYSGSTIIIKKFPRSIERGFFLQIFHNRRLPVSKS